MGMLTKKEKAWVEELNKVLAKCPSKRIGFMTIGDNEVFLFDATQHTGILELMDKGREFITGARELNALFPETLVFPAQVEGVSG